MSAESAKIVANARRLRLNAGLKGLVTWAEGRASHPEFDPATTLSLLERKVRALKTDVDKAGCRALETYNENTETRQHPPTTH